MWCADLHPGRRRPIQLLWLVKLDGISFKFPLRRGRIQQIMNMLNPVSKHFSGLLWLLVALDRFIRGLACCHISEYTKGDGPSQGLIGAGEGGGFDVGLSCLNISDPGAPNVVGIDLVFPQHLGEGVADVVHVLKTPLLHAPGPCSGFVSEGGGLFGGDL